MPFLEFVVTFTAKKFYQELTGSDSDTFVDYQKGRLLHMGHYKQSNKQAAKVAHPPLWKLSWGAWNTEWISDPVISWEIMIQRLFQPFNPSHVSLLSSPPQPTFFSSLSLSSHANPFLWPHLTPPNTSPSYFTALASCSPTVYNYLLPLPSFLSSPLALSSHSCLMTSLSDTSWFKA